MGYMLAISAVVLWGLCQIPAKIVKARGRAGVMMSMPAGLGLLFLIVLIRGEELLPDASLRQWIYITAMGICCFPLATQAYFEAVQRAGITTAAPLTRLTPIIVVMASLALGITKPAWNLAVAPVAIFIGGILCARGSRLGLTEEGHLNLRIGLLYAFVATLAWAGGYLAVNQINLPDVERLRFGEEQVSKLLIAFWGLLIGTGVHWIIMLARGRYREFAAISLRDKLLYSSQGIMSFALAYWALFEGIARLGLSRATIIAECWPAAAVLVGLVVFRESMNLQKAVGVTLLIVSGLLASLE